MNILTIGSAAQDIFIHYDESLVDVLQKEGALHSYLLLQEGTKIEVDDLTHATGGGATNTAVSFSRLGFNASCLCKVGIDSAAETVRKKLLEEHVNISPIVSTELHNTGTSFILPCPSGDRTIFAYRGANAHLEKKDLPHTLNGYTDIYITSLSGNSSRQLLPLCVAAQEANVSISINPGGSQLAAGAQTLKEALPYINTFIVNSEEALLFMQAFEQPLQEEACAAHKPLPQSFLNRYFSTIRSASNCIAVITNGADGVYVADGNSVYYAQSLCVPVLNSIGAGDAFGSCFAASLMNGMSTTQAMQAGIINACSVITQLDAKMGLLSFDEITKQMNLVSPEIIMQLN